MPQGDGQPPAGRHRVGRRGDVAEGVRLDPQRPHQPADDGRPEAAGQPDEVAVANLHATPPPGQSPVNTSVAGPVM